MITKQKFDLFLPIAICFLVLIMIVPIKPWLLDSLLSLSFLFSIIAILLTLSIRSASEFTSFPSLLLFLTFFRLGLNIASARMILSKGVAGKIIPTFGHFATEGNLFIGFILFFLITIVNFIVITKGAGRIAEVAARFTLEALSGKQLAIESSVNAKILSKYEAKLAQEKVAQEAEFYGAMDGASKFIKGEAIASLIIIFVNILGGIFIGSLVNNQSVEDTLTLYTTLTIGDGIANQIPSLLISLSSAIMVTRVSNSSLGLVLPSQLFNNHKVLAISAFFIFILGCIPGMPKFIFFPLALIIGVISLKGAKRKSKEESFHPIEITTRSKLRANFINDYQLTIYKNIGLTPPTPFISYHHNNTLSIKVNGNIVLEREVSNIEETIKEVILANAHLLINRQELIKMIERVKAHDPIIIDELFSKKIQLGELVKIFQNLIKEKFPIHNLPSIFESILDYHAQNQNFDIDQVGEYIRFKLSKKMIAHIFGQEKNIHAITFEPEIEELVSASLQNGPFGKSLLLRPKIVHNIERKVIQLLEKAKKEKKQPIVLTNGKYRLCLSKLLEKYHAQLPVLSYHEISDEMKVSSLGIISNELLIQQKD